MKFKIGDKVKCIKDDCDIAELHLYAFYIISGISGGLQNFVTLQGFKKDCWFSINRFIKATNPIDIINKAINEAKNG